MPSFHARMKNKLRTAEQGADTIVWLALSPSAKSIPSGKFFQGLFSTAHYVSVTFSSNEFFDKRYDIFGYYLSSNTILSTEQVN